MRDDILIQYNKVKKMSLAQFRQWLQAYGRACYEEGLRTGETEGSWWSDEQIYQELRREKIGADRARRIVQKLAEGTGKDAPAADPQKEA